MTKKISPEIERQAAELAEVLLKKSGASSVQYALMAKDDLVLQAGVSFAEYENCVKQLVGPEVMYGIGSVSKMFTAGAIMRLVELGKVTLDTPLVKVLPEFSMADPRFVEISLRHLLNHASGLAGSHFAQAFTWEFPSTFAHDSLLEQLKNDYLKYAPGTFCSYCNDGFQLLELVVERLSGQSFSDFLKQEFFKKLGLKNTKTSQSDFDHTQLAPTFEPGNNQALPAEMVNVIGAGGIYTTASELCQFAQVLCGQKILSEMTTEQMLAPEYSSGIWPQSTKNEENSFAFGLGWDNVEVQPFARSGLRAASKGGDTLFYHASLLVLPEQNLTMAVLSSGGESSINGLFTKQVMRLVMQDFGCPDLLNSTLSNLEEKKPEILPKVVLSDDEFARYNGIYGVPNQLVEVKIENSQLRLPKFLSNPAQAYAYGSDGTFVSPDGKTSLQFVDHQDGQTFLQVNSQKTIEGLGTIFRRAFVFQKLPENPLAQALLKVWEKRNQQAYLAVSEPVDSILNASINEISKVSLQVERGYVNGNARIIDAQSAENLLYARDVASPRFFAGNDGREYLELAGIIYLGEKDIPLLSAAQTDFSFGLQEFNAFFKIPESLNQVKITVTSSGTDKTAVVIFDEKLARTKHFQKIAKSAEIRLETGDFIGFIGNKNTKFHIKFEEKS